MFILVCPVFLVALFVCNDYIIINVPHFICLSRGMISDEPTRCHGDNRVMSMLLGWEAKG